MDITQELYKYFCVVKFQPGQTLFIDGRYVDGRILAKGPWPDDLPTIRVIPLIPPEGMTVKDLLAMSHEETK